MNLTFSDVTSAGATSLTIASGRPALPSGFQLGNPPVHYDISPIAIFGGAVTVCINTAGISFSGPQNLLVIRFNGTTWTDITTWVNGSIVCGTTTSFSPFAVANLVQSPAQMVTALITTLSSLRLTSGEINSLTDKLDNALASIQVGLNKQAINQLNAFLNSVQSSLKIGRMSVSAAATLTGAANAIIAVLWFSQPQQRQIIRRLPVG